MKKSAPVITSIKLIFYIKLFIIKFVNSGCPPTVKFCASSWLTAVSSATAKLPQNRLKSNSNFQSRSAINCLGFKCYNQEFRQCNRYTTCARRFDIYTRSALVFHSNGIPDEVARKTRASRDGAVMAPLDKISKRPECVRSMCVRCISRNWAETLCRISRDVTPRRPSEGSRSSFARRVSLLFQSAESHSKPTVSTYNHL